MDNNLSIKDLESVVNKISSIIDKISKNDLSVPVESKNQAELKNIFTSLEKMRVNLSDLIYEVSTNSADLVDSAENLNTISANMEKTSKNMQKKANAVANATNEMTDNMHSVSAAAEELSANMATVSDNASQSTDDINSVAAATEEMTATISEIASNADKAKNVVESAVGSVKLATEKIMELNEKTKEISHVTSSIAGISEQTKLLALNATIEAARAGDAGVRFAVVAQEVKALAVETNKATAEIRQKVNDMLEAASATQNEINQINKVMSDVNTIVASIATSVDMQSDTTHEIASSINSAAQRISQVTNAVIEANFAVQEVAKNISQAANHAYDVSESINQVSNDSVMLKDNATHLYVGAMEVHSRGSDVQRLVQMFKLPESIKKVKSSQKVLFKFSEPFSVEVKELDNQHIGIFDYINKIHASFKQGKSHGEIAKIVSDLYKYTENHFREEEKLMRKVNYKDLDKQLIAHTNLLKRVSDTINAFKSNQDVNMIEVMVFLKDWLVGHIMGMDKKYSPYMHDHNIF